MHENFLFEFYFSLGTIKQIKGIDKSVCVSLSQMSPWSPRVVWFHGENRSPKVKSDLDRCEMSECDGKESEKPVASEEFGLKETKQIHQYPNREYGLD